MTMDTRPLIQRIEDTVHGIPGWTPIDELYTLLCLVVGRGGGVQGDIIEIGPWCGRSTSVLGMAARIVGNTRIHSVDLFPEKNDWYQNPDRTHSFEVVIDGVKYGGYRTCTCWDEPFQKDIAPVYRKYNGILDCFRQTIAKCGLTDIVNVYRGDSSQLSVSVPSTLRAQLVFVDADHSYDAVCADIENTEAFLASGGWMCFDDAFSVYKGVDQAIKDLVVESGRYDICRQMTRKLFVARKR